MLISESKKLIFVHNQKAAGVSIRNFLFENISDIEYLLPNHAYTSDGIEKIGLDKWKDYYSFGFVRNPWSRLVSWYTMITKGTDATDTERNKANQWNPNNELWKYVHDNSSNFKEFIFNCTDTIIEEREGMQYKKSFTRNQLDYFTDNSGKIAVTFIGKLENIREDFKEVAEYLEMVGKELPVVNRTQKADYQKYYDEETRDIVAERFKRDIEYFGYKF